MQGKVGDRVVAEATSVNVPERAGTIEEVLSEQPPRYRVRWEDGHETVISPSAGSLRVLSSERS
jgi:hypothetical protein